MELGCYDLRLICDYCASEWNYADGVYQSRADSLLAAKLDGWKCRKGHPDTCPECSKLKVKPNEAKVSEKFYGAKSNCQSLDIRFDQSM